MWIPTTQENVVSAGGSTDGWTDAGETWVYASADDPTFTFTIAGVDLTTKYSAGMRVKLTQTTAKYFVITNVAFSTDTTITVYGGTDYDLANAAITSPFWSMLKSPFGFPLDPAKWTVTVTDTTDRTQASPSADTWYNLGSISISVPIGAWDVSYKVWAYGYSSGATSNEIRVTLSTANNTESDANWSVGGYSGSGAATNDLGRPVFMRGQVTVAAKTLHYLNTLAGAAYTTIQNMNSATNGVPLVIRAVCAYL